MVASYSAQTLAVKGLVGIKLQKSLQTLMSSNNSIFTVFGKNRHFFGKNNGKNCDILLLSGNTQGNPTPTKN